MYYFYKNIFKNYNLQFDLFMHTIQNILFYLHNAFALLQQHDIKKHEDYSNVLSTLYSYKSY